MDPKGCIQDSLSDTFDIRRYGLENPLWRGDHRALVPVVSFAFKKNRTKTKGSFPILADSAAQIKRPFRRDPQN